MNLKEAKIHGYYFLDRRHCVVAGLNLAVKAFLKGKSRRQLWLYEDKFSIWFEGRPSPYPGEYRTITLPLIDTTDDEAVNNAIAYLKEQIENLEN